MNAPADYSHYLHKTLDPLIGGTVVAVQGTVMVGLTANHAAPTLVIQLRNGQRVKVEAWRDDEGNGPGALVCTHATKPTKRLQANRDPEAKVSS